MYNPLESSLIIFNASPEVTPGKQLGINGTFKSSQDTLVAVTFSGLFNIGFQLLDIDTGDIYQNVGTVDVPVFVQVPNAKFMSNVITNSAGLQIVGGSGSALVNNATAFGTRVKSVTYPSGAFGGLGATATFPVLDGGNLAFDDGSVPPTTLSCRMYTFFIDSSNVLSVAHGADFPKHRPATVADTNLGDGTKAIIGFLYVKNESTAVFVPGTTHLDASGITARFGNAIGYPILG